MKSKLWVNVKWVIKELSKTVSNEPSYFSAKRIIEFVMIQTGLSMIVVYFIYHINAMSTTDVLMLSGSLFTYAGFNRHMTQKQKKELLNKSTENNEITIEDKPIGFGNSD